MTGIIFDSDRDCSGTEKVKPGISKYDEKDLQNLIEHLPFIALVLKKQTREIVACNKLALEAGAVVGKTCFETLTQCNQICPFCKAPDLWDTGKEQNVRPEYIGRFWEGKWLPFSDDLYIHYIWDITEKVTATEELQHSRQHISDALEFNRKILHTAPVGILTYHKSGKCVSANAAAGRFAGTSAENLLEQNFHEILSWKESGLYQAAVKALETGFEQLLEVHHFSTFGKEAWLNASFSSFDSKGEQHLLFIASDITERKKAELLLTKSESRFSSIFKSNFIGIIFWNTDGKIVDSNDAFLKLVGYTRDDLNSGLLNWVKMTPPEYHYLDEQCIAEMREKGFCKPFEKEYVRKDGSRIDVLIGSGFVEGVDQGGVAYAVDISERKKAEKALYASEEKMRYIVKHDPTAIAVYDRNLHYIAVSDRYLQDYNVREEDIMGKHHYEIFPDLPQRWKDAHQRCLSGIIVRNDDDCFERSDGSLIYNRWECRPWYLPTGEVGGMITYTEVTTERKLAENALKESNDRFFEASLYTRNLFESSPDPLVTIDSKGKITDVNKATEIITGFKRKRLIGSDFSDYFTEPHLARKGYETVFLKGTVRDYPLTLLHKTGRTREVLYNATVFKNIKGEVQGVFAAARDITEMKKMEEELRKSKESLEILNNHLVEVRENERAVIARDLHDQLGQSLTALKLDINRMKGFVNSSPEACALLNNMVEMTTNTITDVQRITSDLRPGILDDLGLVSAIDWYCGEFSARTGIKCKIQTRNVTYLDSKQSLILFRVLQEALTNVIRHAGATVVRINITQSFKGTTLSIHDNGKGITVAQAESEKSLGLIGIRERIKQHQGWFRISSKEGTGAKLTIFIPSK